MVSKTVFVLAEGFGESLEASRVAQAIARGVSTDGRLRCDVCALNKHAGGRAGGALDGLDFDKRMRAARALVIASELLDDRMLAGSVVFEAATRARQAGVPAYAVTACDELDPFEARIVDLQVILQASTARALSAAGRKLATLV